MCFGERGFVKSVFLWYRSCQKENTMDLLEKAFLDIYTNPHKLHLVCDRAKGGNWYFAVLFDQDDCRPILIAPAEWSSKRGAVDGLKKLLERIVAKFEPQRAESDECEVLTTDLILRIIECFSDNDSVSVARLAVIA